MKNQEDLPRLIETFFSDVAEISKLEDSGLFLCREDGVVIYANNGRISDVETSHVGALLGGVWQAASALAAFMPNVENEDFFRLSFDTSSKGIYIIPVELASEKLYLGLTYFEQVNPGMVKSRVRNLAVNLEAYLKENFNISKKKIDASDFLFSDITENEMDNLFPFS